ncbi:MULTISPECIES: hypothetical protein [Rhodanobacter]|uniref:Uncharacterized protein n=2 Tax=Rhodanobacter TaxID=75309 RepID=I4W6B9_9GAMM|nr:hypothetical protein [Rhodanobacter spathiphylli]EIL95010.1 hypothetical protein UU7_02577 [Rhodanobacter spathiphylli B39]
MECVIASHKGVDRLLFGMSASQVRALLHARFNAFKRSPDAAHPTDHFVEAGLFANYDRAGQLEAIELASPAAAGLYGINLLGMGFDEAVKYLKSRDPQLQREVDGAISLALGLSLYVPYAKDDPKAPAESVLVFAPGYYD